MIKKIMNKFRKKEEYIDFTNNSWKTNYLIGLPMVLRPYKKPILALSAIIFCISLLTPFTNLFLIPLSMGVLKKWG